MKLLWVLGFFLAFSAEVRVKANAISQSRILSCEDSWISSGQLTSGCHWILGADESHIRTAYGEIFARNADFTVELVEKRVYVVNHLGDLVVKLKDGQSVTVPQGFEFWFSELGEDKKNQMGLLRPVEMKDHLKLLNAVWDENPHELKELVETYKKRWGDRTEKAAGFYQGLVQRKIASQQAKEDQIRQRRLNELKRREANRKMLFDRVFGR